MGLVYIVAVGCRNVNIVVLILMKILILMKTMIYLNYNHLCCVTSGTPTTSRNNARRKYKFYMQLMLSSVYCTQTIGPQQLPAACSSLVL